MPHRLRHQTNFITELDLSDRMKTLAVKSKSDELEILKRQSLESYATSVRLTVEVSALKKQLQSVSEKLNSLATPKTKLSTWCTVL